MAWDTFVYETGTSVPGALFLGLKQLVHEGPDMSPFLCRTSAW